MVCVCGRKLRKENAATNIRSRAYVEGACF